MHASAEFLIYFGRLILEKFEPSVFQNHTCSLKSCTLRKLGLDNIREINCSTLSGIRISFPNTIGRLQRRIQWIVHGKRISSDAKPEQQNRQRATDNHKNPEAALLG